jgi:hypothetical protein
MFKNIEGFDYGTKSTEAGKEYRYAPRTIESIQNTEDALDTGFDTIISSLSPTMKEDDKDKLLLVAGQGIGAYLQAVSEDQERGNLDIQGEMRALAGFQGFLERELMKRGPTFVHLFHEPSLLHGINSESPFMHAERINEKMRGAEATVQYLKSIEKDKELMFIGSEVGLDCRHAIDLVLARGEGENIKRVDLVQVKSSLPSQEDIAKIIQKHKAYAQALVNFESSAVGTDENDQRLEKIKIHSPEQFDQKMHEFANFYNNLVGLGAKLQTTWESLVDAAGNYNHDPVLFYIRLKSINNKRLELVPKPFMKAVLQSVKSKTDMIELPQAVMAEYNRAVRGPQHITSAEEIDSVIVAAGKVINRLKLTK